MCQSEATTLLDALIETKLIEQTETQRFRPTVKLTSRGQQVMTGQLQLDRPLPVSAHLRRKLQQVPASQPVTSAARGGDRVSRRGADSAPAPPAAGADRAAAAGVDRAAAAGVDRAVAAGAPDLAGRPDFFWTWRVIDMGCSLAECARIRRLDQAALVRHLLLAAEAAYPVRAADVFTPDELRQLARPPAEDDHDSDRAERRLSTVVTADQQALFLHCEDRDSCGL